MPIASRYVGREAELALLADSCAAARDGRATYVLVGGEPGIGKSRLVEQAARASGLTVAYGRSWESGGAPPYWPWIQIFRELRRHVTDPALSAHLGPLDPDAPLLGRAIGSPEERFALFDAAVRFVDAAVAKAPVVLVLEDLHASDPGSLQLLEFVAAHLRRASLCLVGTYRDIALRRMPETQSLLERVARHGHRVVLGPLEGSAVAALAKAAGASDDALDWLTRNANGNPLFVTELLHVLKRGEVRKLPEGIRAAIREHLSGLPEALTAPLEAAAMIDREVPVALLSEMCGRCIEGLKAAVDWGVLVERSVGTYAFSHALIAETLRQDLTAARRAELHLKAADALTRGPNPPLADVARHLFEAGPASAARAIDTALLAAEHALSQLAAEQAQGLLARVLATAPSEPKRFEALLLLGRARTLTGEDDSARAVCLEAAELMKGNAESYARATLAYGYALTPGTTDRRLVDLLEESLRLLPVADHPLRARALARLAAALQPAVDPQGPVKIAREAVEMARRLGDDRTRLDVYYFASAAFSRFVAAAEREGLDAETLELSRRFGERLMELRSHLRLAYAKVELGKVDEAWAHVATYEQLAEPFRLNRLKWPAVMMRALQALFEGRLEDHRAQLDACAALVADEADPVETFCSKVHAFVSATVKGDHGALERATAGLDHVTHGGWGPVMRAQVYARLGRIDDARAAIERSGGEYLVSAQDTAIWCMLCDAAFVSGHRATAETLMPHVVARGSENGAYYLHGSAVVGPVARAAMQCCALLGRWDEAKRWLERGLELMHAQRGRPFVAHLHLDWAEALLSRGLHAEAQPHLDEAQKVNDELGLALAGRIFEARNQGTGPKSGPSLVREGDVWKVSGFGTELRLKGSRGLEMLARLIESPGREVHALELSGSDGAVDGGDAGEVIDSHARNAYRRRLLELAEEVQEATEWNDPGRAARAREEAEAIQDELKRGVGLGGKVRRQGAAAERARINVQRRLADAIKRIGEENRELGEHLGRCIRTGTYCAYHPERIVPPQVTPGG